MENPEFHKLRNKSDIEGRVLSRTASPGMSRNQMQLEFTLIYAQTDWHDAGSPLFLSQTGSKSPTQVLSERLHPKKQHSIESQLEEISSADSQLGETHPRKLSQSSVTVAVPPVQDRWRYHIYHDNRSVDAVLEEFDNFEGLKFRARLSDGSDVKVS